jgi:hypothetical protein
MNRQVGPGATPPAYPSHAGDPRHYVPRDSSLVYNSSLPRTPAPGFGQVYPLRLSYPSSAAAAQERCHLRILQALRLIHTSLAASILNRTGRDFPNQPLTTRRPPIMGTRKTQHTKQRRHIPSNTANDAIPHATTRIMLKKMKRRTIRRRAILIKIKGKL